MDANHLRPALPWHMPLAPPRSAGIRNARRHPHRRTLNARTYARRTLGACPARTARSRNHRRLTVAKAGDSALSDGQATSYRRGSVDDSGQCGQQQINVVPRIVADLVNNKPLHVAKCCTRLPMPLAFSCMDRPPRRTSSTWRYPPGQLMGDSDMRRLPSSSAAVSLQAHGEPTEPSQWPEPIRQRRPKTSQYILAMSKATR